MGYDLAVITNLIWQKKGKKKKRFLYNEFAAYFSKVLENQMAFRNLWALAKTV